MTKPSAVFVLAIALSGGWPRDARAVDLDELAKYLGFIEGVEYLFETCQAETKLPDGDISFAKAHIAERKALIFTGLTKRQREKISADAQAKKNLMLDGVMKNMKPHLPDKPLTEMCKDGLFSVIAEAERRAQAKEVAAIVRAKQ